MPSVLQCWPLWMGSSKATLPWLLVRFSQQKALGAGSYCLLELAASCLFLLTKAAALTRWLYSNHFSTCAFRSRRDEACFSWDSSPLGSFPSYCPCALSRVWLFCDPHGLWPPRLLRPGNFPGKNTEVDCHFLLQGIFLTQGLNLHLLCLLHCRQILSHWAIGKACVCVCACVCVLTSY